MAARQGFKSRPGGARQLTFWKGCHGRTSGIQFEARRRTSTHKLEGKSWPHVRDSIRGQEAHVNSHTGREGREEGEEGNRGQGGERQLIKKKERMESRPGCNVNRGGR